ncbi:hypothetical protein KCTC52924_02811 [Arenibacter antarcticus]|uniref:LytR/AlgR family response regulator transcription factor n=1 Tax=Arenibacter antarcticus TaxID=2040469 RepID=A0ABW5VH88_9FLAO|nr:LytTR family DNA-binding domain-containing protein [Arenibacter sp. H213]MCM4167231.1 hypothetical protein [Arenibacter sp. H213]
MKRITKLLTEDIPYLDTTRNKLFLIGFISLYSFIFIKIYDPYDINEWGKNYYLEFILIGLGVFLISHFILRPLFKIKRFKIYSLVLWGLMEMLMIALVFEIVYSPPIASFQEKIIEYFITFKQIGFVIVVPYTLFLWYTQIQQKLSSYRQVQFNTVESNMDKGNELLIISGENNKVILAIKYPKLLYIKSAGNYLEMFYLKGEKLTKELIRMSFKELEGKINDPNVIRIHRSYMINAIHISSIKKTKKGYALHMQNSPEEVIPVSSGYKEAFEKSLGQRMSH